MQYYVDTNILFFIMQAEYDEIDSHVKDLFEDPYNVFRTSTVCVHELIHLFQTKTSKSKRSLRPEDIISKLLFMNLIIEPVNIEHLNQFAKLPLYENHKDPNDRLIIAQAISDKIPLISSDLKFPLYVSSGLQFIQNKR